MLPAKVVPISRGRLIVRQRQKRQAVPPFRKFSSGLVGFLNTRISIRTLLVSVVILGAVAAAIALSLHQPGFADMAMIAG